MIFFILKNFKNKIPHFHLWLIIFEIDPLKLVLFKAPAGQNLPPPSEVRIISSTYIVKLFLYIKFSRFFFYDKIYKYKYIKIS